MVCWYLRLFHLKSIMVRVSITSDCSKFRDKFDIRRRFISHFQSLSAPFRAPDSVIACNYSSTSLVVNWRHLLVGDFQGKPIGYKITYYPVNSVNDVVSLSVNYTTNTTTLTNLTVYTMYVINVSAVSSGGIGQVNTANARTGAEGRKVSTKQSHKDDLKIRYLLAIGRISIRAFFQHF